MVGDLGDVNSQLDREILQRKKTTEEFFVERRGKRQQRTADPVRKTTSAQATWLNKRLIETIAYIHEVELKARDIVGRPFAMQYLSPLEKLTDKTFALVQNNLQE